MRVPDKLENAHVLLRRMVPSDIDGIRKIAFDKEIWKYYLVEVLNEEDLAAYMKEAMTAQESGARIVFAIIDKATGELAGSTSYANISPRDQRLEIGWSWLGRKFQGSQVNRSTKFLLFRHAFESEGYLRVELKTDVLNQRARAGLVKVGCTEEGVLRSHTLMHGGRRRDTIFYSILASEWAEAKKRNFADLL